MKTSLHFSRAPLSSIELQSMWSALNASYFSNRLPPIEIQWSSRLTSSVGLFVSQSGPRIQHIPLEIRHGSGRVIRLSLPLLRKQSVTEIRSTLAHEMIHQWQFDVKKCNPSHGREFRKMMNIMNEDGLGITVYHALDTEVEAVSKYAWQCRQCGRSYHRQRKSLSAQIHRCASCWGELREVSSGLPWSRRQAEEHPPSHEHHRTGMEPPTQLVLEFMSD